MRRMHFLSILTLSLIALPAVVGAEETDPPASSVSNEASNVNPWELAFFAGSFSQCYQDHGFDLVSSDDWLASARVGLEAEVVDDWFVGLTYRYGSASTRLFETYDSSLDMEGWELGIRKGFLVTPWFRPYASVAGIYQWYTSSVSGGGQVLSREDPFFGGHLGARGGLGFELFIPRSVFSGSDFVKWLGGGFTLGLAAEAGYGWQQTVDFSELSPRESDVPIAGVGSTSVDMGSADVHGWYWSIDFRVMF